MKKNADVYKQIRMTKDDKKILDEMIRLKRPKGETVGSFIKRVVVEYKN